MSSDNNLMENSINSNRSEFSIDCYQMYTASEIFAQGLAGIVNQSDVEHLIRGQKQMLMRFEKTNEMMVNCNQLSANRLKMASDDFKKHTKQLQEMKKDLDYIFKKICNIKTKLNQQYPTSFAEARQKIQNVTLDEADEEQEAISVSQPSGANIIESGKPDLIVLQKSSVEKRKPHKNNIDYVKMEGQTSPLNQRRSLISNQSSSTDNSSDSG